MSNVIKLGSVYLLIAILCACASKPAENQAAQAAETDQANQANQTMPAAKPYQSAGEIIAGAPESAWRTLDVNQLMQLNFTGGAVLIELAPQFAPLHVENLKTLVRAGYFDGLALIRSQDNFVVQWGDPNASDALKKRALGAAQASLAPEYERASAGLSFVALPDADGFADVVGFSEGFPVGRDSKTGTSWLAHCYGMVGAGRDEAVESGSGAELYAVTGQAPRQLDRNIALLGRVISGMEFLSTTPRGPAPMGFFADASQHVKIKSAHIAADLPAAMQPKWQAMRVESPEFNQVIEARRNRLDSWYKRPAGYIDLCNVPLPVRQVVP